MAATATTTEESLAQTSSAVPARTVPSGAPNYQGRGRRSALEESLVAEALEQTGHHEDPTPEGKRIAGIEVYVAQVFDRRDPIPNFVNIFHARTRDYVIRQEVLLTPGQTWDLGRVLETERNLRNLRQLSLANVVAVRGASDDTIELLVVAKDVWSLRLNNDWEVSSSGLEYLYLNLAEENLAGTRTTLGVIFLLERDRYLVGGDFYYPRLGGTRYEFQLRGGVYQNRWTGQYEGNYGRFDYRLPQFSRHSRYAYGTSAEWQFSKTRIYQGSELRDFRYTDPVDGVVESIPVKYDSDSIEASYWWIRSFGVAHKTDLTFAWGLDHQKYRPSFDQEYSPEAERAFIEEELPVSDTRLGPSVTLEVYETRFLRALNIESLGLQEDWSLGYSVSTTLFAATRAWGSSRDLLGATFRAGYTWPLRDGLLRFAATNRSVLANDAKFEGKATTEGRIVSPRLFWGRFHLGGFFAYRYYNYLNSSGYLLGGDNRLRGYAPGELRGTNLASVNAEWRSDGVDILSAQVGMAVFYDLGAADDRIGDFAWHQGAGLGIRFLLPQLSRVVLRFDWAVPLTPGYDPLPGAFVFKFGQAFAMPSPSGGDSPFFED